MKFICVKNYNSNRNKLIKDIYKFLITMIPNSIFNYSKIDFFQRYLKMNQENIFFCKNKKKIIGLVSYLDKNTEKKLKKILIIHLLKNPLILLKFVINFSFIFKIHTFPSKHIQLFHLALDTKKINTQKKLKTKKDISVNSLHRKITKNKYHGVYATYNRNNFLAERYYLRNKFKIYNQNLFFRYVKKGTK
tara:strand:+ start:11 stop:583 length:573 start_codon:yes stop_codon:yes gene_type:complete